MKDKNVANVFYKFENLVSCPRLAVRHDVECISKTWVKIGLSFDCVPQDTNTKVLLN